MHALIYTIMTQTTPFWRTARLTTSGNTWNYPPRATKKVASSIYLSRKALSTQSHARPVLLTTSTESTRWMAALSVQIWSQTSSWRTTHLVITMTTRLFLRSTTSQELICSTQRVAPTLKSQAMPSFINLQIIHSWQTKCWAITTRACQITILPACSHP